MSCVPAVKDLGEIFRGDARAEQDYAVLGGWYSGGTGDTTKARWFSLKVTADMLPEFSHKGSAQRTVAAWELLTTLFCVGLLAPEANPTTGSLGLTGVTDNRGDSFAVAKLASGKYPAMALLMQLSVMLQSRG